jgi:hypothetical protein
MDTATAATFTTQTATGWAIVSELHQLLGSVPDRLATLTEAKAVVADVTEKYLLYYGRSARYILIVSSGIEPQSVRRNADRMRLAKHTLSRTLGRVIELPLAEGEHCGRSYALWRMLKPLSSNRLLFALQRSVLAPAVLRWLCDVGSETLHRGDALLYSASLERLLTVPGLSEGLRAAAQDAQLAFQRNQIAPLSVLQHGDLWIGNVLRGEGHREFALIDWPGATTEGFPFYDLIRFACSIGVGPNEMRQLLERYSAAVHCAPGTAMAYLLAGLGKLHEELEHFPEHRFVALCEQKASALHAALDDLDVPTAAAA